MLTILRGIVQRVNTARNLDAVLRVIVHDVRGAMEADVCSVYLHDPADEAMVLMATEGLNCESEGTVRLTAGQGLASVVKERSEPVNLDNAPAHERFLFIPGSGEEPFPSYLGVPIVHHRDVLGVLVVQRRVSRIFAEDKVTFLMTIAGQLAGGIAHAQVSGNVGTNNNHDGEMQRLQGLPGAPGVAFGTARVVYPRANIEAVPDRETDDIEAELRLFDNAVEAVKTDMRQLRASLDALVSADDRMLFDAYVMMLDGESFRERTRERIRAGSWAPGALRDTVLDHMRLFNAVPDALLQDRASDVADLGRRVMERLLDEEGDAPPQHADTILVGEEVTATMLAEIPLTHLQGVVTVHGSQFSHTAILARALGVPCIMGVSDMWLTEVDGQPLILDGYRGHLYINPTAVVVQEFSRLAEEEAELSEDLKALKELPAETTDGHRVALYANSGLLADINPSLSSGAEGIGLYRTEFPFMVRDCFPGEGEQTKIYRQVLIRFNPKPVTLRTLDIGGDKALPYFPIKEDNPFLGWRGVRITLDHPEVFLTQLRAMLRASEGLENLSLMLPMISGVNEVDDSIGYLKQAYNELREEGLDIRWPRVGVMVEVPAAVYQIEALSRRVDFISVGTNDLTQYLLAVDRNNERVAALYDSLHPSVLAALMQIVASAEKVKLPVAVCGEMAGDPVAVLLLVGMGIDELSTSAASLPRVKWVIRNFSRERSRELLATAMQMEVATDVRSFMSDALVDAGLGGLVRAGK